MEPKCQSRDLKGKEAKILEREIRTRKGQRKDNERTHLYVCGTEIPKSGPKR